MDFDFDAFAHAWASGNADACAAQMHPDGVWLYTEGETESGREVRGRAAVRAAAQAMFDALPGCTFEQRRDELVGADRALCEWTFTATTRSGRETRAWGLDVLTLAPDGLILVKDSYLKRLR